MPDAVAVSVAKGVTAQIAAAVEAESLSQTFVLERSYADWAVELSDPSELRVDVALVTTKQATELSSRGALDYAISVDVAVRKRFGSESQDDDTGRPLAESVDELMLLVEELSELFIPQRLTTFVAGAWQSTSILAAPVIKHLRENRQFTGIVRVTFLAQKELA